MNLLTYVKLGYVAFFLVLSGIAYSLIAPASVAPVAFVPQPANATVLQPQSVTQTRALAHRGNAQAEYRLARAYASGRGVALDAAAAATWYAKAAAQGYPAAETSLGWAYYIGAGVPQNTVAARHWLARAAARGDRNAVRRLRLVRRAQAPADLAAVYHG